jgi:hypothetical protein
MLYKWLDELFIWIGKTFIYGIKRLWDMRSRKILVLIITAITLTICIYKFSEGYSTIICIFPIPLVLFTAGCISRIKHRESKAFKKINFKDRAGNFPIILDSEKFKKNRKTLKVLTVKSMIPFEKWKDNKNLLDQAFNCRVGLRKTERKQIIKLFVEV